MARRTALALACAACLAGAAPSPARAQPAPDTPDAGAAPAEQPATSPRQGRRPPDVTGEPILEPGRPMRFSHPGEDGTPLSTRGAGAKPSCLLAQANLDRTTTTIEACRACHDLVGSGQCHPVGMAYRHTRFDLRAGPEAFNGAIVLPGGMLTCTTCHDPRSGLAGHLAAPTGGPVNGRLCVACHAR